MSSLWHFWFTINFLKCRFWRFKIVFVLRFNINWWFKFIFALFFWIICIFCWTIYKCWFFLIWFFLFIPYNIHFLDRYRWNEIFIWQKRVFLSKLVFFFTFTFNTAGTFYLLVWFWFFFVYNFVLWLIYIFSSYSFFDLRCFVLTFFIIIFLIFIWWYFIWWHIVNIFFCEQQFLVWDLPTHVDALLAMATWILQAYCLDALLGYCFDTYLIWIVIWLIHTRVLRILENWSSFPTVVCVQILWHLFTILKGWHQFWIYLSVFFWRLNLFGLILLELIQDGQDQVNLHIDLIVMDGVELHQILL